MDAPELPSPGVEFRPDLLKRFGAFAARLAAARDREEAGRKRTLQGEGQEFVGHRPYRAGEDLKHFDWDLFARLDRAFMRVHRSEARESWVIAVDTSASMGIGVPGKLQSVAEAAAAAIAVGLRLGSSITLLWQEQHKEQPSQIVAKRSSDQREMLRALGGMTAMAPTLDDGDGVPLGGLERHLTGRTARLPALARGSAGAGRVILLGDFLDVSAESVLTLARGRRRVHVGQVLADEEWDPFGRRAAATSGATAVSWVDPETGVERAPLAGQGTDVAARYVRRLESFVSQWTDLARHHSLSHAVWSASDPFESFMPSLLR